MSSAACWNIFHGTNQFWKIFDEFSAADTCGIGQSGVEDIMSSIFCISWVESAKVSCIICGLIVGCFYVACLTLVGSSEGYWTIWTMCPLQSDWDMDYVSLLSKITLFTGLKPQSHDSSCSIQHMKKRIITSHIKMKAIRIKSTMLGLILVGYLVTIFFIHFLKWFKWEQLRKDNSQSLFLLVCKSSYL